MTTTKYPGWRTMTASQRYNAKMDNVWREANYYKQLYCKHDKGTYREDLTNLTKCSTCGKVEPQPATEWPDEYNGIKPGDYEATLETEAAQANYYAN